MLYYVTLYYTILEAPRAEATRQPRLFFFFCIFIFIYVYLFSFVWQPRGKRFERVTPSPPMEGLDLGGFDSGRLLNSKGWEFSCPLNFVGSLLESLTQGLLIGKLLIGGLGILWRELKPKHPETFASPNTQSVSSFCFLLECSRKFWFWLNPLKPFSESRGKILHTRNRHLRSHCGS